MVRLVKEDSARKIDRTHTRLAIGATDSISVEISPMYPQIIGAMRKAFPIGVTWANFLASLRPHSAGIPGLTGESDPPPLAVPLVEAV